MEQLEQTKNMDETTKLIKRSVGSDDRRLFGIASCITTLFIISALAADGNKNVRDYSLACAGLTGATACAIAYLRNKNQK